MTTLHSGPAVGFIGTGFMGEVHARAARQAGARLVVAASRLKDSAEQFAQRQGFSRATSDPFEVIADPEVDVVHILSPNTTHPEFAAAALRAGKHVICEKPIATTVAAAAELLDLAKRAGVVATVPFVYRFHPMVREARARVLRGEIGRLLTLSGTYLQDWLHSPDATNWRVGGELGGSSRAVADIGSHLLDLIEFVAASPIESVDSRVLTAYAERDGVVVDTEDAAVIIVQLANGAVGTLSISQVAVGHKNDLAFELSGTSAGVAFRQEDPDVLHVHDALGSRSIARGSRGLSDEAMRLSILPAGHPMGYQDAFNAFIADTYAAVAGSLPDGLPTFVDGHRSAVLVDAVLESAALRCAVDLRSHASVEAVG